MIGSDVGQLAAEITDSLSRQLGERWPEYASLEPRDGLAVENAITLAAWRGILRGMAEVAGEFNCLEEKLRAEHPDARVAHLELRLDADPEPDLWAQRFGRDS